MIKRALCVPIGVIAMLIVGTQPAAAAWHKDPDVTADLASLQSVVAQLVAPDATLGETDITPVGVGADAIGIDDSMTNPPADPPDDSPGNTYFVNNNPSNMGCPATIYTTIQAAVEASGPGDKVKVCPGTYTEQVRITGHIHDGLKLESVEPLHAIIKWPAGESFPLALVDFNMADHVTLRSFTITGPFTFGGCSPDRHEGVLVENAFGERIHHNHITHIQNSLPALYGCQEGDAVSIGRRTGVTQPPGSAEVDHNQIDEYQKNGIQAVNSGTSAQIDHNVVTGSSQFAVRSIIASNGVVVFGGASAVVDHNVISGNQFTGENNPVPPPHISSGIILDEAPANSSRIDHNRVSSNDYGIEVDSESNLEISHNDVRQNTNDAITVCGDTFQFCGAATAIVVRSNNVQNNGGSGILLLGSNNNLIKSNDVDGNGSGSFGSHDGIHLDTNSTGNQVLNNHAFGNQPVDCFDGSGTANTWAHNKGDTSTPPGLCTS